MAIVSTKADGRVNPIVVRNIDLFISESYKDRILRSNLAVRLTTAVNQDLIVNTEISYLSSFAYGVYSVPESANEPH